jgi:hypothetical protein
MYATKEKVCFSKSNKRSMPGTIIGETEREGQKKAKRRTTCKNQK